MTAKAKSEFRPVIKSFIDGKEPDEVKVELILSWVVGVVENAEQYGWVDDVVEIDRTFGNGLHEEVDNDICPHCGPSCPYSSGQTYNRK